MIMKSPNFFLEDYKNRLAKLQHQFALWQVDGCVVEDPIDLLYLLGLQLSLGTLIVTQKEARLFVDGRYLHAAQSKSPVPVSALSDSAFTQFIQESKIEVLAFDSHFTTFSRYRKWVELTSKFTLNLKPIDSLLKELRAIKEAKEQQLLQESAELLVKGFHHLETKLETGITERELALEFEIFCRLQGAEKLAFDSIIAFGKNSAMPHYRSADIPLKLGDLVLIDIGVVFHHYHSDMTRVLFWGERDPLLEKMLGVAQAAQQAALIECLPGKRLEDLDFAARREMQKENMEEYFVHNLGHGIGLEIHEFPRVGSKTADKEVVLKEGMVITIEPGLYIPDKGGVRYEDMVLVTDKGGKKLTRC